MLVLRPIQNSDFAALKQVAIASGHGFTSLPVCDERLSKKIARAVESINKPISEPEDEGYLFVLEDKQTGEIVGTTAIESAVGMDVPLYHYKVGKSIHHSKSLNVYNEVEFLTMCNDYTGASEICTLFLKPSHRSGAAGRFLSRIRFLFMADHRERFNERVIAEMRGVSDSDGHSPFWEWLQAHFFSIDFPTADHLIGIGDKSFIAELMPKHPIYVNLLGEDAQAVIGEVHEKTKPALRLLEKEGFEYRGYVDLFDAGPTVEAKLDNIESVKQSQVATLSIADVPKGDSYYALSNRKLEQFKATFSNLVAYNESENTLSVTQETADLLNLNHGDSVRFLELI